MKQFYFDTASTTRISETALSAYNRYSKETYGNPSSLHDTGKAAKEVLETSRATMEALLGSREYNLIFTSGASESNSIVLSSLLWKRRPGAILVSPLEHPSVTGFRTLLKEKGYSWNVCEAPGGLIDPTSIIGSLTSQTQLIVLSAVHNILGTIQPIRSIYQAVKQRYPDIHIHLDATQAPGKTVWDLETFPCDSFALSAHKIHGPKGIGVLAVKKNSTMRSLSSAGGQEQGMRGGTENLPAVAAFSVAIQETLSNQEAILASVRRHRELLDTHLKKIPGLSYLSPVNEHSVPNILTISTPLPSEVFLRIMNDRGFALSASSACSSNTKGKQILDASISGFSDTQRKHAVRISWDRFTSYDEISRLITAVGETIETYGRR